MNGYWRKTCIHFTSFLGIIMKTSFFFSKYSVTNNECFLSFGTYTQLIGIISYSEMRLFCLYSIDLDGSMRMFISWRDNRITPICSTKNILL
jgi:hypothetical protein